MKKILLILFLSTVTYSLHAQLNIEHNGLRSGDIIIKQQVEYKNPEQARHNQIWNFKDITLINAEYTLSYTTSNLIGDSITIGGKIYPKQVLDTTDLLIGTEHNTMYYFSQTTDLLFLTGTENITIKQENTLPILNMKFPLNYGDSPIISSYETEGIYSGTTGVKTKGIVTMGIDAFGIIILPSGDTINPVVRVKTEQTIFDISEKLVSQRKNDKGRLLESYRWYSKGYRYPIFETIECLDLNSDSTLFATAFYFPPQEHNYLDTDPENLALLEKLWEYTDSDSFKKIELFEDEYTNKKYKLYPNPVENILNIEYELENSTSVNIIMATIDGRVVKNIHKKSQGAGLQYEEINCSNLMTGAYLIKIVAGDLVINERVMKK